MAEEIAYLLGDDSKISVPAPVCCSKDICNVYLFAQSCWEGCTPNWVSWEYTPVSFPAIFNMFLIIVCDSLLRSNWLV